MTYLTVQCLFMTFVCATAACTKIDACERTWPADLELNRLTEGDQAVTGSSALGPMPQGGALLVFRSQTQVASEAEQHVLRGVMLDRGGAPIPTCQQDDEVTYTKANAIADVKHSMPSLAPPAVETGTGLISFVSYSPLQKSIQIMGLQLSASGCPINERAPEAISQEPNGYLCELCENCNPSEQPPVHCAVDPVSVRLDDGDFAVFWITLHFEFSESVSKVRGRVFMPDFLGLVPQPTAAVRDGSPVDIEATGHSVLSLFAHAVPGKRIALAWQERPATGELRTKLQLYDALLSPRSDAMTLHSSTLKAPEFSALRLALRSDRMLAVWTALDDEEIPRVYARLVEIGDEGLEYAPARAEAFRVSTSDCGSEGDVSVTALSSERAAYLVAWKTAGCDASGTSVRAIVLDADGWPVFGNHACNVGDFQLVTADRDNQTSVVLTTTLDGSVVAAWTDFGKNGGGEHDGSDRSGSAIRGVRLARSDLIPE